MKKFFCSCVITILILNMFNTIVFASNPFSTGQCTWYAYQRWTELLGYEPSIISGNAGGWYDNATSKGFSVGSTPKVGAIACWNNGFGDDTGHVAIVESVNSDSIYISEYNWTYSKEFDNATVYFSSINRSSSSKPNRYLKGYIYLPGTSQPDPTPEPTPEADPYVDLGTDFYAVILQRQEWIPITCDDDQFVRLHSETGSPKQLWKFIRQDDGCYVILSAATGKALEVYQGNTDDGTSVAACSDDWGGYYQRWFIYEQANGYVIMSKHFKDYELVLDLRHDDKTDGGEVISYRRNNNDVQIWGIYKVNDENLRPQNLTVNPGNSATKTTFNWEDAYGEEGFDVKIWKNKLYDGDAYHIEWGAKDGYGIQLPAGNYVAYVDARNQLYSKGSNDVAFTVNDASFTVNFNANGGEVAPAGKNVTYAAKYGTFPIPTREGFIFKGWFTEVNGGTEIKEDMTVTITENQTLYALWEQDINTENLPGDINGDEKVNERDATCLLRYLAGWNLTDLVQESLDVDKNGAVNEKDATVLLRYLAGWDVGLK